LISISLPLSWLSLQHTAILIDRPVCSSSAANLFQPRFS
jgi:hypothetical protein